MNVAKSLYLGGKIIYANDKRLNYYSYKELGLLCPVCGEPVHFRKGECRKPYFAHFKGTDPKQVEECNLRASAYGNSTQGTKSNFIEDKGQRIEIFEKQFLNIIAENDSEFYIKIRAVNNRVPLIKLENTTKECREYLIANNERIKTKLNALYKNDLNNSSTLDKQITFEAIDYLFVESSHCLLDKLIHYSIYNCYDFTSFSLANICDEVVEIILNTPWLKVSSQIISFNNWKPNTNLSDYVTQGKRKDSGAGLRQERWSRILIARLGNHCLLKKFNNRPSLSPTGLHYTK